MLLVDGKIVRFQTDSFGRERVDLDSFGLTTLPSHPWVFLTDYEPADLQRLVMVVRVLRGLDRINIGFKFGYLPWNDGYLNQIFTDVVRVCAFGEVYCTDGPLSSVVTNKDNIAVYTTGCVGIIDNIFAKHKLDADLDRIVMPCDETHYSSMYNIRHSSIYTHKMYEPSAFNAEDVKIDQARLIYLTYALMEPDQLRTVIRQSKDWGFEQLFIVASFISPAVALSQSVKDEHLRELHTSGYELHPYALEDPKIFYDINF